MKVLLVDDDDAVRQNFAKQLTRWGYDVVVCASEDAASQFLSDRGGEVDIAVLDMHMEMPKSGLNLIKLINQLGLLVPAVVLTGFADWFNVADCMAAGAVGYVPKEYAAEMLKSSLERAADDRRRRLDVHTRELRDRLERTLSQWFAQTTLGRLRKSVRAGAVADSEMRQAVETTCQFYREYLDAHRLPKHPDSAAPTITTIGDLLDSDNSVFTPQQAAQQVRDRNIRTYAQSLPDPTPLLHFVNGDDDPNPEVTLECCVEHAHGVLSFCSHGYQMPANDMQRANGLAEGSQTPETEGEARLVGFALRMTAFAASVEALHNGADTVFRVRLPLA